jgi:hypothetical protein
MKKASDKQKAAREAFLEKIKSKNEKKGIVDDKDKKDDKKEKK